MIPNLIQKQRQIGSIPGAIKIIWTHIAVYVNAMTFILVMVTAYHTTVYPVTGIDFPVYASCLGLIIIVAMILEYKYIMPSSFRFHFDQSIAHSSLFKNMISNIDNKLDIIHDTVSQKQSNKFKYHRRRFQRKVVI